MPGVGHKGIGTHFLRAPAGVPEHGLFDNNGDHRRPQRQRSGSIQLTVDTGEDLIYAADTDLQPDEEQNRGKDDGGHTFHSLMTVGMLRVALFSRRAIAEDHNKGTEHIGGGMHRIGDHGAGMRHHTGDGFDQGQDQIHDNGSHRDLHHDFLIRAIGVFHQIPSFIYLFYSRVFPNGE